MKNKNVMITGGAGFIGLNFIKYLHSVGHTGKIVSVDKLTYAANIDDYYEILDCTNTKQNINICCKVDIVDKEKISKICKYYGIDIIINFAAESHVDRSINDSKSFVETNVLGVQSLLEVCRDKGLKFVQISTDEVFGSVSEAAIPGITKYNPSNPYAASKAAANHLVRAYGKTYGIDYLITYCTNNFGPHQNEEKFIPVIIKNLFYGTRIPVYGFGGNNRDWIYVVDHCQALYNTISAKFYTTNSVIQIPKSVGIAGHNTISNIELIQYLISTICPEKNIQDCIKLVNDRPAHDVSYILDDSWIRKVLVWKPETSFVEGLRETVSFYRYRMC